MKIEDLLWLHQPPAAPSGRPSAGDEKFADCLKEALNSAQSGQPGQVSESLEPIGEINPFNEPAPALAELADAALARLEIFQSSLAREGTSLKKMAPLVQKLADDSRQLMDAAQGLPEGSPLRQILEETAALAYVEAVKFNRGDYI
ncbi:MAG: hypothetical protein QME75_13985 [Deltaproteobacteria bacterium]|nr:hypothetical protein [Deltaproteobacteria bacterium]